MNDESIFVVTVSSGFEAQAKEEVQKIIPNAEVRSIFFKGNLLVKSNEDKDKIIATFRNAETKYIGRVYPVDSMIKISKGKESIMKLYEALIRLGKLQSGDKYLVRCRRRGSHSFSSNEVERELGALIGKATGATVNLRDPEKVVTVQIFQDIAFIGITDFENIIAKSLGVGRKYKKGERPFTRAEHKIREAIEAFNLKIDPDYEVLDLGASPGGWTKVLSSLAKRVVAVDPAELNPAVARLPNVVHLKCRAEEVPNDLGRFHLIVNDMNLNPSESARIMNQLADHLEEGGTALMTIKFVTRERRHISEAIEILKARYGDFRVKRLPHNRFETTLFMRKISGRYIGKK
jgi:tRNA(Ser,Leu) C12 N-acetylase TAN1